MNDLKITMTVVAICTPAVSFLAVFAFYTVRYTRLRLARKSTLVDHLHDFAGSWTRLVTRADPPEEQYYLRRMLLAGAIFMAYVLIVMAVVGGLGDQEVLRRDPVKNTNVPLDGIGTPLVTKGLWAIRCYAEVATRLAGIRAQIAAGAFPF